MPERLSVSNTRWLNLNVKRLNVLSWMKLYASFSVNKSLFISLQEAVGFWYPNGTDSTIFVWNFFFDRYSDTRLFFLKLSNFRVTLLLGFDLVLYKRGVFRNLSNI